MHYIKTIAQKEFSSFFKSPAAYMVLVGFLVITGWFFANPLFLINQSDLRTLLSIIPIIFLIFIPAITMGLVSKENNSGTIELLATLPVKSSEIVIGKFLAGLGLIVTNSFFNPSYNYPINWYKCRCRSYVFRLLRTYPYSISLLGYWALCFLSN